MVCRGALKLACAVRRILTSSCTVIGLYIHVQCKICRFMPVHAETYAFSPTTDRTSTHATAAHWQSNICCFRQYPPILLYVTAACLFQRANSVSSAPCTAPCNSDSTGRLRTDCTLHSICIADSVTIKKAVYLETNCQFAFQYIANIYMPVACKLWSTHQLRDTSTVVNASCTTAGSRIPHLLPVLPSPGVLKLAGRDCTNLPVTCTPVHDRADGYNLNATYRKSTVGGFPFRTCALLPRCDQLRLWSHIRRVGKLDLLQAEGQAPAQC